MDNVLHEKEQEGMFFGGFSYLTDGTFTGSFEAKCGHACLNIILQKTRFTEGLAVIMDDQALAQTINSLHVRKHFGLLDIKDMESIFLVNWREGELDVFGSLMALYQVLKSEKLDLLPLTASLHPIVAQANLQPECARGYLYYLESHWMVLRQLAQQWYKFDPWLGGPQLLSHFYVSLYVKQLVADGKLVFLIDGDFPKCPADENEVVVPEEPQPSSHDEPGKASVDMTQDELAESLRFLDLVFENEEDNKLALALLLSLEDDIRKKLEEKKIIEEIMVNSSSSSEEAPPLPPKSSCTSSTAESSSSTALPSHSSSSQSVSGSRPRSWTPKNGFFPNAEVTAFSRRKVGTCVNPYSLYSSEDLNSSSDSNDTLAVLFSDEVGSRNFDFFGDEDICQNYSGTTSSAPTSSSVSRSSTPLIRPTSSPPPPPAAHPRVFITALETTPFKKVLGGAGAGAEAEEEEEAMCCVCWAEIPSHVVVPCGHFCLCTTCSVNIAAVSNCKTLCPLCKQESSSIIKLYK